MHKRLFLGLALTAGVVPGLALASPALADTTTSIARADSFASKAASSSNYGSAGTLAVDGRPALTKVAFISFDVPAGPQPDRVTLRLRPRVSAKAGVRVYAADSAWAEERITWDNRPRGRSLLGSSGPLTRGVPTVIKLRSTSVAPGAVLSLRLVAAASKPIRFASSEAPRAAARPTLVQRVATTRGTTVTTTTGGTTTGGTTTGGTTTGGTTTGGTTTGGTTTGGTTTGGTTTGGTTTPSGPPAFPAASPITPKVIGLSAPANLWDQRIAEVGATGVKARRIFATLSSSGSSSLPLIKQAIADGMMPVISYKVPSVTAMINGDYDTWLATLRAQLVALNANVTATFWHEPRGDMPPADFRAASLKFFNLVDAPSIAVGPILNGWLLDNRVAEFASYTDASLLGKWEFVAVDSYQSGTPTSPGTSMPARAIPLLESWMDSMGHPDTPLGVGEYNGFSAQAIADAGETLLNTPEVWFGLAWNSTGGTYAPLAGDRITAFQGTKADSRAKH